MTDGPGAACLALMLEEIDRLERGGCAQCERRGRRRRTLKRCALAVLLLGVTYVALSLLVAFVFSGFPPIGQG